MHIEWTSSQGALITGAVCDRVLPFVEAIGFDDTARLLLHFGGASLYLPAAPKSRSPLPHVIGTENARALCKAIGPGDVRIPTAKRFLVRYLKSKGKSNASIARMLHVSETSVRRHLQPPPAATSSSN